MSVVMGTITGLLLLYGAYQMSEDPQNIYLSLGKANGADECAGSLPQLMLLSQ